MSAAASRASSGVLITRREGSIVPIPFGELMDPETGRTRVRMVDTKTESHASAHSLQVRIEQSDLASDEQAARIGEVVGLSAADVRERYAIACRS